MGRIVIELPPPKTDDELQRMIGEQKAEMRLRYGKEAARGLAPGSLRSSAVPEPRYWES